MDIVNSSYLGAHSNVNLGSGELSPYKFINIDKCNVQKDSSVNIISDIHSDTDWDVTDEKQTFNAHASSNHIIEQLIMELSPSSFKSNAKRAVGYDSNVHDVPALGSPYSLGGLDTNTDRVSNNMNLMMEIADDAMREGSLILVAKKASDSLIDELTEKLNAALAQLALKCKELREYKLINNDLIARLNEEIIKRESCEAVIEERDERKYVIEAHHEVVPLLTSMKNTKSNAAVTSVCSQTDLSMLLVPHNSDLEEIDETAKESASLFYQAQRSDSSDFVGRDQEVLKAIEMAMSIARANDGKDDLLDQIINTTLCDEDDHYTSYETIGCQTDPISLTFLAISQHNNCLKKDKLTSRYLAENVSNSLPTMGHRLTGSANKNKRCENIVNELYCCNSDPVKTSSYLEPQGDNNDETHEKTTYRYNNILREYNAVECLFEELTESVPCLANMTHPGYKWDAKSFKYTGNEVDNNPGAELEKESVSIPLTVHAPTTEELDATVLSQNIVDFPLSKCSELEGRDNLAHRLRRIILCLYQELKQSHQREAIYRNEADYLCEILKNRSEALFRVSKLLAAQGPNTQATTNNDSLSYGTQIQRAIDGTDFGPSMGKVTGHVNGASHHMLDFPGAEIRQRYMRTDANSTNLTMRTVSLMMTRSYTSKKQESHTVQAVHAQSLQTMNYNPKFENLTLKRKVSSLQCDEDQKSTVNDDMNHSDIVLMNATLPPNSQPNNDLRKSCISANRDPEPKHEKTTCNSHTSKRKALGFRQQYAKPLSNGNLLANRNFATTEKSGIVLVPRKNGKTVLSHRKGVAPIQTSDVNNSPAGNTAMMVLSPPKIDEIRKGV